MPKFKIETISPLDPQSTFLKIKNFLENTDDLKKIDKGIVVSFNESQLFGQAKGKQFKADIQVSPSNPSCVVSVEIEIPLLLSPLKGKIQETLQRKLQKALA